MSDMIKFYVGVYEERTGKHPLRVGKTEKFVVDGEEITMTQVIRKAFPTAVKELLKKRREEERKNEKT